MSKPSRKYPIKTTFAFLRKGTGAVELYRLVDEQCDCKETEFNVWGVLVKLDDKTTQYDVAIDGYDIRTGPIKQSTGKRIVRVNFVNDDGDYYEPDLVFVDMVSAFFKNGRDQFTKDEVPTVIDAVKRAFDESSAFV